MITLPFGTSSAYTDSFPAPPPKQITVNVETCFNLLQFKGESGLSVQRASSKNRKIYGALLKSADCVEMVKQYRKLDDQIITRLNRAQAQFRDQARAGPSSSTSRQNGPEAMCANLWREMMCELALLLPP